ncbi:MAG: S9 family peptidase [Rhodothermales bacterium]|nr:S9 family peptidase [Rhodothermales bacterium]MBO6779214.1 S9 family peptidase [Rhodothermales bacterium]
MRPLVLLIALLTVPTASAQEVFLPRDVFELERATQPQISPDGSRIVYVRSGFDVMTDGSRTALWIINADGSGHRPLTDGTYGVSQPRWSPRGDRLAYVSSKDGRSQVYVRWMDTGDVAELTDLERGPSSLAWSPDGTRIALSMFVPNADPDIAVEMPRKPRGADWGPEWTFIDDINYRSDGRQGFVEQGGSQLFILPAEGGTPRQVTFGPQSHGGTPSWTPDGNALILSANRRADYEVEARDSEVYRLDLATGDLTALTDRYGPDASPRVSSNGQIAYRGYDDTYMGYMQNRLYVMDADGSGSRELLPEFDRSVGSAEWSADGRALYISYTDEGMGRVARVTLDGTLTTLNGNVGGLSIGRPYSGGQASFAGNGTYAFTSGTPQRPADLWVGAANGRTRQLTFLNEDLLGARELGEVEEIWYDSSFDDRRVHGWIITPPGFDPSQKYPLILEIHGGPFSSYGPHFSAEAQLYASKGYVVLYTNPRGSTSYGAEFGNLIHHAYPGNDYDDLISGVDAVLERGYVDENQLYVTGGSGGGVLTSWIIGKTDRFRAAVVQKPVINWYSFVLNADGLSTFWKYWFPGPPWEHQDHYMARSPISLIGNVTTPTMLITGEVDYRTPMSETEQYYGALKIKGVEASLVRVPDASHGIASRPSNLIAKTGHVLAWFDKYRATVQEASR